MRRDLDRLAEKYCALIESDGSGFRRAARTLQSYWREEKRYPLSMHKSEPLGSRLDESFAEQEMANYLTPGIKKLVRMELKAATDSQVYAKPRIYNDLLSSQPLCFNLFGELKLNLELATEVFKTLEPGQVSHVTDICFEHSPGRSSPRYTGDKSAFDVFVVYRTPQETKGFIGIEIKYHENLKDAAAEHRKRYDEIAASMGCFKSSELTRLRHAPLQQLWRDHLLVGSMLADRELVYSEGRFVFLYPAGNTYCRSADNAYRECLQDFSTYDSWTIEEFVGVLGLTSGDEWIEEFRRRYLAFNSLPLE